MIADLKPYAGYKDSGLPWLGQVPAHWGMRRLKSAVMNVIEQTFTMSSDEVYIALEHVESWTGKARPQSDSSLFTGQVKRFRQGDVLFGKLRPYLAKVTRISKDGVCAGEFFVLRPTDKAVSSAYLEHQLRAKHTIDVINGSTFGAKMPRADWQFCGNLPFYLPPPAEQAAIVRFLDWTNGRLERTVRAKRKVIALLNEQKQAIIHRAVTRGLDSTVPLKPSGIPWLGDIPQHWEVERTKNVFRLRTQKSGLAHGKELLSIYTHIGVRPRKDLEQKGNKASTTDNYWIVRKGDLIVNKLLAWMGAVGSSNYEGVTSPAYDILMPIRPLCSDYYHHLFRTKLYLQLFKQRSRGIMDMRLRLYFDQLGQIPVPFPPVDEQAAIVAFYVEATADLTATISRLEREIELLREYRTRLVADVVTGKLDVREAAARLPELEPESGAELDPTETDETEEDLTEVDA